MTSQEIRSKRQNEKTKAKDQKSKMKTDESMMRQEMIEESEIKKETELTKAGR